MPIDALSVLCAHLTRDLLAIAKFLLKMLNKNYPFTMIFGTIINKPISHHRYF